ncbi:hypothetical protein LBMAG20_06650 [Methylocystaceae bacterium]|nr:hypothetical protein LBMAG20_06650 [Methylocystaceae bacterium]
MIYGGCGPYGHRGPWGVVEQGDSGAVAIMACAVDLMPIAPIMRRLIIRFGALVQPIGKKRFTFSLTRLLMLYIF